MRKEIRLVVADDHPSMRDHFRALFAPERAINLLAVAQDATEAFALIEQHRPDVALLDTTLPRKGDGFALVRLLQERKVSVKALFITGLNWTEMLEALVRRAVVMKARGFILKNCASDEMIKSVRMVAAGRDYFCQELLQFVPPPDEENLLERLNEKECRLLLYLAEGMTSKNIAGELHLSRRTIENNRRDLHEKLNLEGDDRLNQFASEHKIELELKVASGYFGPTHKPHRK